jgi:hypothetical protein
MNEVLIKQPCGLGDILFMQKIAHNLKKQGKHVIWPVTPQYISIKDYIPFFTFVDVTKPLLHQYEYDKCHKATITEHVICTDGCNGPHGLMHSKYELCNVIPDDWKKYLKFNRNFEREQELFRNVLKLDEDDDYIVVNRQIGSLGYELRWNIPIPQNKNIVEIRPIEGFTVFDWCKVFEWASEFHLMETCFCYLIETLDTIETEYKLYHRSPSYSANFKEFFKIYQKPKQHIASDQF